MSWIPGRAHLPAGAEMPGPGMGGGSAQFSLPPVSPSPASARSGENLRRAFMVSGGILPFSAGARRSSAAGVSNGSRRRGRQMAGGRRPGNRRCRQRRRGNAAGPDVRCDAASGRVSSIHLIMKCRAFQQHPTPSGWMMVCAVGFMVSGGRGRDSAEDVEADACRDFRRKSLPGLADGRVGWPVGRVAAAMRRAVESAQFI